MFRSTLFINIESDERKYVEKSSKITLFFDNGKSIMLQFGISDSTPYSVKYHNSISIGNKQAIELLYNQRIVKILHEKVNEVYELNEKKSLKLHRYYKCLIDDIGLENISLFD